MKKIQTIQKKTKIFEPWIQAFKVYIDGVTKVSHFSDTEKMETYFVPLEDVPGDWQGGHDLSCKSMVYEQETTPTTDPTNPTTDPMPIDENCLAATVTNFDKCDWCNKGLIQLPLSSPYSGIQKIS